MDDIEKFLSVNTFLPVTVVGYRSLLADFGEYLDSIGTTFDQINSPDTISGWISVHPGWGDCQKYKAVCAVRSYTKWKFGKRYMHPIFEYQLRKPPMKPQRTLTENLVRDLLGSIDLDKATGLRDYAVICLAVDTGLRKAELCRLELRHVDLDNLCLNVQIKGGKWGQGTFSENTRDALEDWLTIRPSIARKETKSFFCAVGGNYPGGQLTPEGMGCIFRHISKVAGFVVSPHDLRRTMASMLTINGAPSELVRKAGRWSNINMVTRYTQAVPYNSIKDYLPMGRLNDLDNDE